MSSKVIILALVLGVTLALPHNDLKLAKPSQSMRDSGTEESRLGIYDGQVTNITKHPHLVSILSQGRHYCAGAILNAQWVLTDADCVYWQTTTKMIKIVAGSNDGTKGTKFSVKKVVLHPEFLDYGYSYDYALVNIKGNFTWGETIANVSLPSDHPKVGTSFLVAGYGNTKSLDGTSGRTTLREGTMTWQSNSTCVASYQGEMTFGDTLGCVYNEGNTTISDGDFGAPLVSEGVLYGVAVGGNAFSWCCETADPVVVTDVFPVVDWIKATVA